MTGFFETQMDYIYFFYGLAFIVVAQVCFTMRKQQGGGLPWVWLGLFGVTHGVKEWVELLELSLDHSPYLFIVNIVLMTVSFVSLVEFGRASTVHLRGKGPGRWVILPLFALAGLASVSGIAGVDASLRYSLGFVGGLWSAYALFMASRVKDTAGRGWLMSAGLAFLLYALATGTVVSSEAFSRIFGFPVQLLRGTLAVWAAVAIAGYSRGQSRIVEEGGCAIRPACEFMPLFMVFAILLMGWLLTGALGKYAEKNAKQDLLARTLTAAAAINPERVARLTGTSADTGTPDFIRLRKQLKAVCEANCSIYTEGSHKFCRFVYLMGLKDDKLIFLVDAEPESSKDYSPPGQVYEDAEPFEVDDYKNARATVQGPLKDSWGTWVTGVAPILDKDGRVLAQVGMDIDAHQWLHNIMMHRFLGVLVTLVLYVLSMALFIASQRSRESSVHRAALQVATVRLTERRKAEEEKSRLLRAISISTEGIAITDEKDRFIYVNEAHAGIYGYAPAELLGKTWRDTVPPEILALTEEGVEKTLHNKEVGIFTGESPALRKDGKIIPTEVKATALWDDNGDYQGHICIVSDVTERKNLERQRADFYAMVTHDLKSPLTAILGYAELLLTEKKGQMDNDGIEMIKNIRTGGTKLFGMVDDFLAVSRLESGSISLNESLVDVSELILEAGVEFSPLAQQKGLKFEKGAPDNLPRAVLDRMHVYRALSNLLQNAVSYTPRGGSITLTAHRAAEDGGDYIVISVADTGLGIPASERDKVFEKYYRSSRTAGIKGSGLGLAVVKSVAYAHGGKVELDTAEGKGSTFRLFLPINRP